jgi:hypothetical protein
MKLLKAVMLAVVLILVPAYAFSSNYGYMRISLVEGDVQIKTPDADDWGYASINTPLAEGDQVWVPQGGRAELQLNTGTYVRLDNNSALQILSTDKDSSQFYLSQGHAYIYYDAPRGNVIQIDTPDASIRAFDRAVFRIDMSDQYQYTDVAVYKGYVEAENEVGKSRINAGQMVLSLGPNTNAEVAPLRPSDEWERWNKMRNDNIFARRDGGTRYLPAELRAYSYDFDNYGRWIQVPDYGYVWTPTVVVGSSWSPYRDGRWIWWGGDYVWVAYEPWGWAPYHYGRWSFIINIGWFWVPPVAREVYWSPGYVGWVRTADYVAWVPLAPGETYYGRGEHGRHSVNITNVNIKQVNITNVYKNVYVNNGVTVVNRKTFNTHSPTIVNVNKNVIQQKIFTKNNISVGEPDIRPTKGSHFTSARTIPTSKLPPQHVREQQAKELKKSRPLMKAPEKSVLNPGAEHRELPLNTVTTPRDPGKGKPMIKRVKPKEKMEPGVIEEGPAPRGERKQIKQEEKGKQGVTEGRPAPRGERKQIKQEEKGKQGMTEGGPAPRGERKQVKQEEKGKAGVTEGGPAPRGERKQVKPEEKEKPGVSEGGPAPKGERKQVKPDKKGEPGVPECGPGQKDEKNPDKCPQKD